MKRIIWALVTLIAIGSMSTAQEKPVADRAAPQKTAADAPPAKSPARPLATAYQRNDWNPLSRVELTVSRDQGKTWELIEAQMPEPNRIIVPGNSGMLYIKKVNLYPTGTRAPQDASLASPALKLLLDSVAPVVRITNVERVGEEVVVKWTTETKNVNEAVTKVEYKASLSTSNEWISVPATALGKQTARFKPQVSGPIQVRVKATDYAGNLGHVASDVPAK